MADSGGMGATVERVGTGMGAEGVRSGRGPRRLFHRVAAAGVGIAVFVLVASVVEPDRSAAHEPSAGVAPGARAPGRAVKPVLTPEQVQEALLGREHPEGWPLLGMLEGADYYVLIHGSPEGPRYSICSHRGDMLQADVPADDVYRAFPTLDIEGMRFDPSPEPQTGPLMLAEPAWSALD